jgi:hypothetical protein
MSVVGVVKAVVPWLIIVAFGISVAMGLTGLLNLLSSYKRQARQELKVALIAGIVLVVMVLLAWAIDAPFLPPLLTSG